MPQRNVKLNLSWDGAPFSGYQYQPHAVTVQETLTKAWQILTKECAQLVGCSRLDAGVHAQNYVLNLLTQTELSNERILRGLNGILHNVLRKPIGVLDCQDAALDFHARFHTTGKHYRYLLWHGFAYHALITPRCWHVHGKQGFPMLNEILQQYVGEHDFAGFRSQDCGAHKTVKRIFAIKVSSPKDYPELYCIDIWGDGFLKNMIRNMVGTAVEIATEKRPASCIQDAFIHKNRSKTGVCAPGWALTLRQVYYNTEQLLQDISLTKHDGIFL